MKKSILILCILIGLTGSTIACDVCGTGSGGGYFGLLPNFHKTFFGLRYRHNRLNRDLTNTVESFHAFELWGAANIGKRFRITAFLPYNFIDRSNQNEQARKDGIGDFSVGGYYRLFNSPQRPGKSAIGHSLWIGAGIKLPTGKYEPDEKNVLESVQNTFQLGTGSVDYSLNMVYDLQFKKAGINTNVNYWLNSSNEYDYRFGNKFNANVLAYYQIHLGNGIGIAPNVGILFEKSVKDKIASDEIQLSGGHSKMGSAGIEFNANRISAGMSFQTPLFHHSEVGKAQAESRVICHVSFSL